MDSIDQALAAARKSRRSAMDKTVGKAHEGSHFFDAALRIRVEKARAEYAKAKAKAEKKKLVGDAEYIEVPHRGLVPPREARDEEFKESEHPREEEGKFTSAGGTAKLAAAIKAPAHATLHEGGGKHGGGTIDFMARHSHTEAHKHLTGAGFRRAAAKHGTEHTKLGKSTAYSSEKVQHSSYSHPEGHEAEIKTKTPKSYGFAGENVEPPSTYYSINTKKDVSSGKAKDTVAFDEGSVRSKDVDGRLQVDKSHISKATVNPYKGSEIPDYESLGLDKDKVYQLLRHPDELAKAAPTFNRLPILSKHVPITADTHKSEYVIGTTGTDGSFEFPYLDNSLAFWTKPGIDSIESHDKKELSSAYRYKADMTPGVWEDSVTGQQMPYDGIMRDIVGNHLALVKEGRAGHDVMVGDSKSGVVAGRRRRHVMARMTKTAAAGIALMGSYLRPKLAQDVKIDLAPVFKGLTLQNLDERRPGIISEVRELTKGKLAQDASIGEIAEVLDLLEAHPDTGEDAPVTDTQEAMMTELTTVPGAAQVSGSGEPGGDRRGARDRMRARDRRSARDAFPPDKKAPPFKAEEKEEPPFKEREESEDRRARDDDPTAAIEEFLKDKVSGADLQHVCNLLRGGGDDSDANDSEAHAEGEEQLEDLGSAGEDDQGGPSDVERSRDWYMGEEEYPPKSSGQSGRAMDRRAKDRKAKDRRAHDQPPPFKGVPEVGKGPMDKRAMDAAIKLVVDEERKNQQAIRKAERVVRPWVGDLAMDAAMSADDVYRSALTVLGVKDIDKIHPQNYEMILSYQPKPGAIRSHTLGGTRVAMDAVTQKSFFERNPDVARIRVI
jgi:hypothetical protein